MATVKKFKLRVSDTVQVPVQGSIKNAASQDQAFKFTFTAKRLPAGEMRADLANGERPAGEIVTKVATGWDGQDLVLDPDNDQPAAFDADALAAMLDIAGIASLMFQAYLREVGAKEKNS